MGRGGWAGRAGTVKAELVAGSGGLLLLPPAEASAKKSFTLAEVFS